MPKNYGSLTFIIVAFKWTENKTFSFLASSIHCSKKDLRALILITEASMISSFCNLNLSFSNISFPSVSVCDM